MPAKPKAAGQRLCATARDIPTNRQAATGRGGGRDAALRPFPPKLRRRRHRPRHTPPAPPQVYAMNDAPRGIAGIPKNFASDCATS